MADKKQWQEFSQIFKDLLQLETSPVGISCLQGAKAQGAQDKVRICRAFLQVAKGATVSVSKENNGCFGAAWHLGFRRLDNPQAAGMVKKFVVEGEKLFSSYQALDKLVSQMGEVPDNSANYFLLCPLANCEQKPDLVLFVVNPEQACRLLTLLTFIDGVMPKIKIGGPTCRLAVIYPLLSGEVNLSFYDYTSRKMCNVDKDKLLLSIPYKRIPQMIAGIDKCTAGKAKMEYPPEFREFLQKSLAAK